MIKVRVGQVWKSDAGTEVEVESIIKSRGNIFYKHPKFDYVLAAHVGNFRISYAFAPQNDLEWLAVNESEWDGNGAYPLIVTLGGTANYTDSNNKYGPSFTRQQWQNMRYYLGLDKKPHYKLINGQWSEMK